MSEIIGNSVAKGTASETARREDAPRAWTGSVRLNALLPSPLPCRTQGSVDRYGFLHLLAKRAGLHAPRRPFAEWVHGWVWDEVPTAESLAVAGLPRNVTIVVRNEVERRALIREGFLRVIVGGLPFAYVARQHTHRNMHALLAIPPHSAEVGRLSSMQREYMDYLESIGKSFEKIYVSVYHLDWDGPIHKAALARGLQVVQGARPDDINSLRRVRALFDAFDVVTTNTMGSHFVYALHAGARMSFCGPWFEYDPATLRGDGNPNKRSERCIDRLMEIQTLSYLKARFGQFFVDSPSLGVADQAYGAAETGSEFLLSPEEIIEALGWSWRDQAHGLARGGWRRLGRRFGSGSRD